MRNGRCLITSVTTIQGVIDFDETQSLRAEVRGREGVPLTCLQTFNMSQSSLLPRETMELEIGQRIGVGCVSSEFLYS